MFDWLRSHFKGRPGWANALMLFAGYMTFVYIPWDFFIKPVAVDEEVWFGILFHGTAAKILEIPHWFVYAAGFYGLRYMKSWMWPWAAVYAGQVAVGMLIWPLLYVEGFFGLLFGVISFIPFAGFSWLLWESRSVFQDPRPSTRERYGEWAVVTGASAGIGKEFARALAADGMSVVLTARRGDRLRELADELEKNHQVSIRVVEADLTDPAAAEAIATAVSDLEVGVLVANAGFGYAGRIDKQETARLTDMVQVNCAAVVALTSRFVPAMVERGRGGVIITGSAAAYQPMPLHAVYAASKVFDQYFGEALAVELRDQGVDVMVIEPGRTETEFQDAAGEQSGGGQLPHEVVETAFDALGRAPSVISGWFNWLRGHVARRLFPRSFAAYLAREYMARQVPPELR
ncbi:MAG: SDR family NAD(P)-dependent oxidoreductase [Deltaproteobacteria bacterium]|nr:MAG: SDR family NAD(P)-dependent oxidoreductase [Deltaproteobacteria bacterium]